jgi:plastocyanin
MKTNTISLASLMLFTILLVGISSFATKFSVDVKNFEFTPADLPTVRIGDTIHWEWKSGSHTTTSTSIPSGAAAWDQPINSTNTGFDYVPAVLGTYNYKCTIHAAMGMTGSFTVTPATAVPDPSVSASILIYPNPFVDKVTFRVSFGGNNRLDRLRVLDITGAAYIRRVIRE